MYFSSTLQSFNHRTQSQYNNTINSQFQEVRILFVIQIIRTNQKMSIRCTIKTYDVPQTTLRDRMKSCISKTEERNTRHNLTSIEKEILVRYILDLDSRGFSSRINDVRDMIDLLYKTRHVKSISKQWLYNFVQRRFKLKTCFLRTYNF